MFNNHVFRDWVSVLNNIEPSDRYIVSYPELLNASSCLAQNFGAKSVPMVAHLVYGWMPKVLSFSREPDQNSEIFKAVRAKTKTEALKVIQSIEFPPTNNAWVGMSKTLHFFNPSMFPIWDSKVAKVFGISAYKMSSKDIYLDYVEFIFSNTKEEFVSIIQSEFKDRVGYEVSEVRALEFTLFNLGKNF